MGKLGIRLECGLVYLYGHQALHEDLISVYDKINVKIKRYLSNNYLHHQ
jgi:hypothetical protein